MIRILIGIERTVNVLHDYIICLILLPVNAPMVNCQDELSLHLLQEEAQAPGGSLSRIILLPVSAEPNRRPWAKGGIACLVGQFGSG